MGLARLRAGMVTGRISAGASGIAISLRVVEGIMDALPKRKEPITDLSGCHGRQDMCQFFAIR